MNFEVVQQIIKNRRTVKPAVMNGKKIEDPVIHQLIELADWAPTHGHTEPWRFTVFSNDSVKAFCEEHASIYRLHTSSEKFETAKYEKILHNGDKCSHIIAVFMKCGNNPKITRIEEICATASAVQNILLGAAALNIAALWSTGGLTFHHAMKEYFKLNDEDQMMVSCFLVIPMNLLKREYVLFLSQKKLPGKPNS